MTFITINMPAVNSNENRAELNLWIVPHGTTVDKNQTIAIAETTKATS